MIVQSQEKTDALNTLYSELTLLPKKYNNYIKQESLIGEVQCLTDWIAAYREGSEDAGNYLKEYGSSLLETIKNKLKAATTEIQRIDEGSPQGVSNLKRMRGLNNATKLVAQAEEHLEEVLEKSVDA